MVNMIPFAMIDKVLLIMLVVRALLPCRAVNIEIYRLSDFPPDRIALHMPCEESNMFATKW